MSDAAVETEEVERDPIDVVLGKLKWVARKKRPVKLVVTLSDGDTRQLPVTTDRRRWEKVRRLLDGLDWYRVEALDRAGELLLAYETDGDDDDDDDNDELTGINSPRLLRVIDRMVDRAVARVLNAQDIALKRQGEHQKELLAGATNCVRVISESQAALARLYEARLKLVEAAAEDGEGDGLMSTSFVDGIAKAMAPAVASRVAESMFNGKPPPPQTPPNGQPGQK